MEIDNLHSAHITNCDLNTAKALNFILRMLELWKGYPRCFHSGPNWVKTIQVVQLWVHPNSHLDSWYICTGGEWTLNILIPILSGSKLWKGVFQVFPIRFQVVSNNSRWHRNESACMHMLISHWRRTHSQAFESHSQYWEAVERGISAIWFRSQLISNSARWNATNLPLFSSGFPLILHYRRPAFQALKSHSLILKLWKGVSQWFPSRSQLISNNSRCNSIESASIFIRFPTDSALGENRLPRLWISFFDSGPNWFLTISDGITPNPPQFPSGFPVILHWERTCSWEIDSDSQWIGVVERETPCVFNEVPTGSWDFQMTQQRIHSGGEQTIKPLNIILSILMLWKGIFQLFSWRSWLISNNSRWHSNKSHLGTLWFHIEGEQKPKPLNLIISILKL